jgi:hypothetical protein
MYDLVSVSLFFQMVIAEVMENIITFNTHILERKDGYK